MAALLHVEQEGEHLLDFPMRPFQIGGTWVQVIPTLCGHEDMKFTHMPLSQINFLPV